MNDEMKACMTTQDVCDFFKISKSTVKRARDNNEIEFVKKGRLIRFEPDKVAKLFKSPNNES